MFKIDMRMIENKWGRKDMISFSLSTPHVVMEHVDGGCW